MNEEDGSLMRHSRESLVYLTKCMIGHPVEAHLKNGSVYSGRFHAADLEKDSSGIVLKMAFLIKDGTLGGHKPGSEVVRKPPMETFFIPADQLVQVVAKDLSVFSDGKLNALQSENSVEPLTDSSISKPCRVDQGRELNPRVPDGEAPEDLDNAFDKSWKSGELDRFKATEEFFGVKSTFKDLDKEKALRIAGETEDENTGDIHVAEERGLQINEKFDTVEEAKYSAVRPVDGFDDSGFDEEDDRLTFGMKQMVFRGSSTSNVQNQASSSGKGYGGESQPFQSGTNVDQSCSISDDHACHLPSEQRSKDFPAQGSSSSESQLGERRNNNDPEVAHSNRTPEETVSGSGYGYGDIKNLGGGGTSASRRSSESGPAPSTSIRPGLSPSSSSSSLPSSGKFILNPNAKEFKPSQRPAPVRPQSPIAGGSFYYAAPRPPVQQMPLVPAGYGMQQQYLAEQQQLPRYPGHEYPQTYYPPKAPPEYREWQQMMMEVQDQKRRPPNMDYLPLPPP